LLRLHNETEDRIEKMADLAQLCVGNIPVELKTTKRRAPLIGMYLRDGINVLKNSPQDTSRCACQKCAGASVIRSRVAISIFQFGTMMGICHAVNSNAKGISAARDEAIFQII
jgi:hypothetical protein